MWSRKHKCCVVCGTTKYRYKCKGMCYKCYNKTSYLELLEKNPNEQHDRYVRALKRDPNRNKKLYRHRITNNPDWNKDLYLEYSDNYNKRSAKEKTERLEHDAAVSLFSSLSASGIGG